MFNKISKPKGRVRRIYQTLKGYAQKRFQSQVEERRKIDNSTGKNSDTGNSSESIPTNSPYRKEKEFFSQEGLSDKLTKESEVLLAYANHVAVDAANASKNHQDGKPYENLIESKVKDHELMETRRAEVHLAGLQADLSAKESESQTFDPELKAQEIYASERESTEKKRIDNEEMLSGLEEEGHQLRLKKNNLEMKSDHLNQHFNGSSKIEFLEKHPQLLPVGTAILDTIYTIQTFVEQNHPIPLALIMGAAVALPIYLSAHHTGRAIQSGNMRLAKLTCAMGIGVLAFIILYRAMGDQEMWLSGIVVLFAFMASVYQSWFSSGREEKIETELSLEEVSAACVENEKACTRCEETLEGLSEVTMDDARTKAASYQKELEQTTQATRNRVKALEKYLTTLSKHYSAVKDSCLAKVRAGIAKGKTLQYKSRRQLKRENKLKNGIASVALLFLTVGFSGCGSESLQSQHVEIYTGFDRSSSQEVVKSRSTATAVVGLVFEETGLSDRYNGTRSAHISLSVIDGMSLSPTVETSLSNGLPIWLRPIPKRDTEVAQFKQKIILLSDSILTSEPTKDGSYIFRCSAFNFAELMKLPATKHAALIVTDGIDPKMGLKRYGSTNAIRADTDNIITRLEGDVPLPNMDGLTIILVMRCKPQHEKLSFEGCLILKRAWENHGAIVKLKSI